MNLLKSIRLAIAVLVLTSVLGEVAQTANADVHHRRHRHYRHYRHRRRRPAVRVGIHL